MTSARLELAMRGAAQAAAQAHATAQGAADVSVGLDLVQISRIEESLATFGDAFCQRLFTPDEIAYAHSSPAHCASRLAARFAAKEAALKALDLADQGVGWRDIEVQRLPDGACQLALHGRAWQLAQARGLLHANLSLTHESDHAAAIVLCRWAAATGGALLTPSPTGSALND